MTASLMRLLLLLFLALSWIKGVGRCAADEASPEDRSKQVSYWKDIRPIFQAHCQGCHQPAKPSGEYIMTDHQRLLGGGASTLEAVVPGEPDESFLVEQITPIEGQAEMPQGKPPLAEGEIELISEWIRQGAKDDTPQSARHRYSKEHPPSYGAAPVITSLDFSPHGGLLAVSGYHEVLLYKIDNANEASAELSARLIGMSERIEKAVFSPDGKRLAVSGGSPGRLGELQVWDVQQRELVLSVPVSYDTCYGASWSPGGELVAIGCPDNTVRAFDAASGQQVFFNGAHNDWVLDTVFSKDGSHLVSVSRDRSMKLFVVKEERFVDNITSITPGALKGGIHAVDRHPQEDQLAVAGADGVPKLYRMFREKKRVIGDDYNLIREFEPMSGRVFAVAFSADGTHVVSGSSHGGTGQVHLYKVEDGKLAATMSGISGPVYAVAVSGDGGVIASGGYEGVVRLHDATGQPLNHFTAVPLDDASVADVARPASQAE